MLRQHFRFGLEASFSFRCRHASSIASIRRARRASSRRGIEPSIGSSSESSSESSSGRRGHRSRLFHRAPIFRSSIQLSIRLSIRPLATPVGPVSAADPWWHLVAPVGLWCFGGRVSGGRRLFPLRPGFGRRSFRFPRLPCFRFRRFCGWTARLFWPFLASKSLSGAFLRRTWVLLRLWPFRAFWGLWWPQTGFASVSGRFGWIPACSLAPRFPGACPSRPSGLGRFWRSGFRFSILRRVFGFCGLACSVFGRASSGFS